MRVQTFERTRVCIVVLRRRWTRNPTQEVTASSPKSVPAVSANAGTVAAAEQCAPIILCNISLYIVIITPRIQNHPFQKSANHWAEQHAFKIIKFNQPKKNNWNFFIQLFLVHTQLFKLLPSTSSILFQYWTIESNNMSKISQASEEPAKKLLW